MASRVLFLALLSFPVLAADFEGVRLEDHVRVDGQVLQLNGAGLRTRYALFKVYVAGLYLRQRTASAQTAIEERGAKRMALVMLRDVPGGQFAESFDAAMRANNSEAQLAEVKTQTDVLFARIRAVGEARKGMLISVDYAPSAGTTLLLDGVALGKPLPGEAFYRAVLRSWIGEKPVQEDLKKALLGG